MKNGKKWLVLLILLGVFLLPCATASAVTVDSAVTTPTIVVAAAAAPVIAPAAVINWDKRHTFEEQQSMLKGLATQFPKIAKTYSIGHSYLERQLWCVELTSSVNIKANKVGIAIFGNIHGGEQESGESAAYTAWWLANNYGKDQTATKILDNYIIYVIPIINPDGYVQSFTYPTRQNMRPTDRNGVGGAFSDPYMDTNGDGVIAAIYQGSANSDIKDRVKIGMESFDLDKNGIFGDDHRASTIDLNRTFDYMWNRYDPAYDQQPQIGANAWANAGPGPATEPEVQAVQNFLISHPVYALATLHTGIQCVLWPWCYTPEPPKDAKFMEGVSIQMAKEFETATGRRCYTKQSYADYPTAAELIDWAYGRLGIHAYTMEVYAGGMPNTDINAPIEEQCTWKDKLPEDKWIYMGNWQGQKNIWFLNSSYAQTAGVAPPEQSKMVIGTKNAMLKMILSEPSGSGPKVPAYLTW